MSLLDDLREVARTDLAVAAPRIQSYVALLEDSLHVHRALHVGVAVVFLALGIVIGHFGK